VNRPGLDGGFRVGDRVMTNMTQESTLGTIIEVIENYHPSDVNPKTNRSDTRYKIRYDKMLRGGQKEDVYWYNYLTLVERGPSEYGDNLELEERVKCWVEYYE
jgi:hypothetical protein